MEKKFWIVINENEDHPNQSENRCSSYIEALEKASDLVKRYPYLNFVVCEAKNLVRVKNPIEVLNLK